MFMGVPSFNADISRWDVSRINRMDGMFEGATSFNADISGWDVHNVTDMNGMFRAATSFNVNIAKWDVSRVTNMNRMFYAATSFNHTLCTHAWSRVFYAASKYEMFMHSPGSTCSRKADSFLLVVAAGLVIVQVYYDFKQLENMENKIRKS